MLLFCFTGLLYWFLSVELSSSSQVVWSYALLILELRNRCKRFLKISPFADKTREFGKQYPYIHQEVA